MLNSGINFTFVHKNPCKESPIMYFDLRKVASSIVVVFVATCEENWREKCWIGNGLNVLCKSRDIILCHFCFIFVFLRNVLFL